MKGVARNLVYDSSLWSFPIVLKTAPAIRAGLRTGCLQGADCTRGENQPWHVAAHRVWVSRPVLAFHPGTASKGLIAAAAALSADLEELGSMHLLTGSLASSLLLLASTLPGFPFFPTNFSTGGPLSPALRPLPPPPSSLHAFCCSVTYLDNHWCSKAGCTLSRGTGDAR